MKHTPGPWKLNVDEDTGMNDSGCILDSVGHVIVTDIYGTFKNGRTTGEAEANARLIAAAPDLLAALEFNWNVMRQLRAEAKRLGLHKPSLQEAEDKAADAIAKARGGE